MVDFLLRQLLLLLQPLGLVWMGLFVHGFWLLRIRRWGSAAFVALLWSGLALFACTDFPGWLLRGMERPWAGVNIEKLPVCDAVVVLGGGSEPSRYEVGEVHLTKAGDRLMMGMELLRLGKAPNLVLGGNAADFAGEKKVESEKVKALFETWRVPATEILSLGESANTREEGEKVRALVETRGWKRVLLVTSAAHMSRALAVFRTLGIDAVPAPCNFLTTVSTAPVPFRFTPPHPAGFEKFSIWAHETAGWWIYRQRGWIAVEKAAE